MEPDNLTFTTLLLNQSVSSPTEPSLFSPTFQILAYISYNLIFLLALLGNSLVLIVLLFGERGKSGASPQTSSGGGGGRGSVTNLLIAHLALADLLLALFCVPFSYNTILLQYWPFGPVLCTLLAFAQPICVFLSAYTLVLLALDRYLAILHPLRPHLTKRQVGRFVGGVWAFSTLLAIPLGIFTGTWIPEDGLPRCEEVEHYISCEDKLMG